MTGVQTCALPISALLGGSVDFLQDLDVWPRCRDQAAALLTMRLVDDTGRLVRAPEVRFSSDEIGLDRFGFNIENRALMMALEQRASEFPNLREAHVAVLDAKPMAPASDDTPGIKFDALASMRLAAPFERLRDRSDQIQIGRAHV